MAPLVVAAGAWPSAPPRHVVVASVAAASRTSGKTSTVPCLASCWHIGPTLLLVLVILPYFGRLVLDVLDRDPGDGLALGGSGRRRQQARSAHSLV